MGAVWRYHFGGLAKDIAGTSKNPDVWHIKPDNLLANCDDPILWNEILRVLKGTRRSKAPGINGSLPTFGRLYCKIQR